MNKLWYIHTMEYYLVKARNNLLLHRELDKSQGHYAGLGKPASKVIYCMTPFICQSGKGKNIETETDQWFAETEWRRFDYRGQALWSIMG